MRIHHLPLAFIALAVVFGCESPQGVSQMNAVDVPAARESFAPRLFNVDGVISMSWLEAHGTGHSLHYATWNEGAWSDARQVASGDDWFANWADLPGVRRIESGGWVAWWLQKSAPDTYAYDVQLAFSDDGIEWRHAGTPHSDGTPTEHGFVTAFDLPDERLGLAWLDGRNTSGGHGSHAAHGKGGMTLRYGVFSGDGELVEEAQFDGLTCDCCQTDSTVAGDAIVLVYRDRTEQEIRDIYSARYQGGEWSEAEQVHADGWKIDGCPVNGPAVAASDELVGVAWFTAPEGKGEVRFAWSRDGGRSFEAPLRMNEGQPQGRVDVVMHPEGGALVTWMEQGRQGSEVRLRRVMPNGDTGVARTLVQTDAGRATGFPRIAVLPDGGILLAWTEVEGDARRVRSARFTL